MGLMRLCVKLLTVRSATSTVSFLEEMFLKGSNNNDISEIRLACCACNKESVRLTNNLEILFWIYCIKAGSTL